MHRTLKTLGLLLVLSAGLLGGRADAQTGPPTIDPQDPHRFLRDGLPWYPAGYYPGLGSLTVRQPGENLTAYNTELIDKLAANGINYFRAVFAMGQPYQMAAGYVQTMPYPRTGPGLANDGLPKFNLNQWNQAHFNYWKALLTYARDRGVVVQLTLFESWHNNRISQEDDTWGQKYDFYNGANNINGLNFLTSTAADSLTRARQNENNWHTTNTADPLYLQHKKLLEKAVDELGSFPNLIWEVCNEAGRSGSPGSFLAWELALADLITAREQAKGYPRHLVMPRDMPNHQFAGGQQGMDPAVSHTELIANFSQNKPLIADNDAPGTELSSAERRRKAWAALTAGAHIDYFHFTMGDLATLRSTDVSDGMRWLGYLPRFLTNRGVNLRGMQPRDNLVTAGDWCYARAGQEYVVYLPAGRSTSSVTVQQLPPVYTAFWFNPRNANVIAATGGPTFTPPTAAVSNDWVLHIKG